MAKRRRRWITWAVAAVVLVWIGLAALLAMHVRPVAREVPRAGVREELVEGFRYVWSFKPVRALLLLCFAYPLLRRTVLDIAQWALTSQRRLATFAAILFIVPITLIAV